MPRAVLYAILVHIALVALLVVSLDWTPKPELTQARMETVQAELVDVSEIRAEQGKRQQEEARLKRLEEERRAARQREEERKIEEQREKQERQEKLKKQQEAEALALKKKLDAEKLKKEQEAERITKLKQQKEVEEKKRKEEDKRLAELETKRKAEEDEKRRRAEERKRRMEAQERELQEKLDTEQQGRQVEQERVAGTEIGKYTNLIRQKVDRNWLRPQNARDGLSCWLQVRLSPGGEVLVARVTQSSGDVAFDRSAEAAVYKASPLPVPQDASLFDEKFREFKFYFNPGR